MSLLEECAGTFVVLRENRAPDGAGGWTVIWREGPAFTGRLARDTALEARLAEREGAASSFTVLADRDAPVGYGDYIRDERTGRTYRVASHPDERQTPGSATLPLKAFTVERGEPPT